MSQQPVPQELKGVSVLVVDDNKDVRGFFCRMLALYGADVHGVASVEEALGVIAELEPRAVVTDITMPGLDGYDLIRALRGGQVGPALRQVPAVSISGHDGQEDFERSRAAGFQAHLGKPVEITHLVQTLAQLTAHTLDAPPAP